MSHSFTGKHISQLPTPSLMVDLPVLKTNLATMQALVSSYGKALRPHVKTHKCSRLAQLQIEAGAIGVTCATVGEAEAMVQAGIRDILIANQLVTPDKLERVAALLEKSDVKFVVDSETGIASADKFARERGIRFDVLVEVDVGGNRCGAQSPAETVHFVQKVLDSSALCFGGLQAYNGGDNYHRDLAERARYCELTDQKTLAAVKKVQELCAIPRISGAGTGSSELMAELGTLTEIQSGTYVYSDTTYRHLSPQYQPALFVLSAVLSHPLPKRIIMDGGLKSLGTEFSKPEVAGYSNLEFQAYSEEHVQWQVSGEGPLPAVGEKVRIIPSHVCTTVNHHRVCYVVEGETVVDVWPIDGF
jgi:D-serine deaminase-like pyridoxal phosphate-dependent protein